jgi:hypothetical protein
MDRRLDEKTRRHPLCPRCKYDLVATVQANKRVCPECGHQFTLNELIRAPREGDWTLAIGFRKALLALAARSVLVLPFWAGLVWLLAPLVETFPFNTWAMGGIAVLFILPGVAMGHAVSRGLNDIAGCQSYLFTTLAVAFELAIVIGGVKIAEIWRPMPNWGGFVVMTAVFYAALWTLRNTHFSD